MADTFNIAGVTVDQVYQTVRNAGVADADAKLLVSNWIYQHYLTLGRTFSYATAFPAAAPACVPPPFVRTLVHRDWVDGEDLVQAGESANDEGMNKRFHHVEADLDTLAAQVAKIASCMADMRASLRALLDEIAAELNRVDSDIADLRGPTVVHPLYPNLPAQVGVLTAGALAAANQVSNPVPGALAGDPAVKFLGTTTYQQRAVSLFNTSQGIVMLPTVDASTPTSIDVRTAGVGALAQAMSDNAAMKAATAGAITRQDLVTNFGNVLLSNGQTVAQAVAILPQDAQYASSDALLTDLAQRNAGAIQSTTGLPQQLATAVNAAPDATSLSAAGVSGLQTLPPEATTALRNAGITTIGQLASAAPDAVATALHNANVSLSAGEIAAAQGTARTLSAIQLR
jgi:hypothetical protein